MEPMITNLIKQLLLPPGVIFLFFTLGLLLLKRAPKASRVILWSTLVTGYLLSTPLVANFLNHSLEFYPALKSEELSRYDASVIVILSSERYRNAPEYGDDTLGSNSLARVRYGAYLHRQTSLPIIVSGGIVYGNKGKSLAQVMADSLNSDFNIDEVIREERSKTTGENAYYTKVLLDQLRIDNVFLVTNSIHMPRAVASFRKEGITVIPAPTIFIKNEHPWYTLTIPSARALYTSRQALHEWLGLIWYKIRH